jgi:hypothetical protein
MIIMGAGILLELQHQPSGGRQPEIAKTPLRAIRISDELWGAVAGAATENGETVSDVIRRALNEYVADQDSV